MPSIHAWFAVASRRAMLGRQAGSERLGVSLFELAPEQAPFPLHYHLGNEELLIVLRGTPMLRTLDGSGSWPRARSSRSRSASAARIRSSTAPTSRSGS